MVSGIYPKKLILHFVVFLFLMIVYSSYAQESSDSNSEASINAATLLRVDFEDEYPTEITDWSQIWFLEESNEDSSVFCNQVTNDWVQFQFGSDSWENYAIRLRMKFLSDNSEQSAEIYSRINDASEGYRASIWNNQWASIEYYPPPSMDVGASVSIDSGVWYEHELKSFENVFEYYIDGRLVVTATDDRRSSGRAGVGASPNTAVCVDDILVWELDESGNPVDQITLESIDSLSQYEGDCAFCFIYSDPLSPIWSAERQGHVPRSDDLREQIVIDENFTVRAGEEVVFENQIVWVRPTQRENIEIDGRLIIRDSLVLWDQTEHQQTKLIIRSGAELRIENSYAFWANQYWVNWEFEDEATIYYDRFVGNPWTSINGAANYTAINYSTVKLTLFEDVQDAVVNVSDAHHVWFEVFPPAGGEYTITFPEKRQWANWDLSHIWPNTVVSVSNSYIFERDISMHNDTHITITDTPSGFSMGWGIFKDTPGFVECEIRNLGEPGNDEGVYYENMVWDLPCVNSSLTVKNSVLQRAWPFVWGYVHLRIYESNIADLRNYGGPSIMDIFDSSIEIVSAERGGTIFITNSNIHLGIEVKDNNSAVYAYRISGGEGSQELEIIERDGGTYVELEMLALMQTTGNANLRTCASTACDIGASAESGSLLHVIGEEIGDVVSGSDLWYLVAMNGHTLYVHSSLVEAREN